MTQFDMMLERFGQWQQFNHELLLGGLSVLRMLLITPDLLNMGMEL
ncbi:MAG: hypothetical protein LR015_01355 [Verrucomicrobia bacterium]|nr:hypothetical protein [Verrucomicrobiota bacterium]